MKLIRFIQTVSFSLLVVQTGLSQTANDNYVRTYHATDIIPTDLSTVNDVTRTMITIGYADGLGRSLQSVTWQGSPLKQDIIQPVAYDLYGRQAKAYLPFTFGNTGAFNASALTSQAGYYINGAADKVVDDTRPYSETTLESSELNRPIKSYGPGNTWGPAVGGGNDKYVYHQYLINTASASASFSPQYLAILNQAAVLGYSAPSISVQIKQDKLVRDLVAIKPNFFSGDVDCMYIFTGDNSDNNFQAINWIQPTAFTGNFVSTIIRDPNLGIISDGTSYFNTNYPDNTRNDITSNAFIYHCSVSATGGGSMAACGIGFSGGTNILAIARNGELDAWSQSMPSNSSNWQGFYQADMHSVGETYNVITYKNGAALRQMNLLLATSLNTIKWSVCAWGAGADKETKSNVSVFIRMKSDRANATAIYNAYMNYFNSLSTPSTPPSGEPVIAWTVSNNLPVRETNKPGVVNGYYTTGQLSIKSTIDEQNHEVREYTDKEGHVILKKVQVVDTNPVLAEPNHWAQTYYIYDKLGLLRFVLQPELSRAMLQSTANPTAAVLGNYAFLYKYDGRNRMIVKKVPGADSVYMVYDPHNRLVLTQDGNQRAGATGAIKYWTFTKYDQLNRPIMTGIKDTTTTTQLSRCQMQTAVNAFYAKAWATWGESYVGTAAGNVHGYSNKSYPVRTGSTTTEIDPNKYRTITYYDKYTFVTDFALTGTHNPVQSDVAGQVTLTTNPVTGLATGTKVNVLGNTTFLYGVTYYDSQHRVIQVINHNNKGSIPTSPGWDRVSNLLDFSGRVTKTKTTHHTSTHADQTVSRRYIYDHAGRVKQIFHTLNTQPEVLLVQNDYNELGQLVDKKLHSTDNGTTFKQSVDYRYNIRGWLTSMNNSQLTVNSANNDDANDMFGMELAYEGTSGSGNTSLYNGNISAMKWSQNMALATVKDVAYNYSYDALNRITGANYKSDVAGLWSNATGEFNESGYSYDQNGNILSLTRQGPLGANLDKMTYSYGSQGNQLLSVTDSYDLTKGFVDGNQAGNDYNYDLNGNMTFDKNKGLVAANSILYNYLNLPATVIKGSDNMVYTYDATGKKLTQVVNLSGKPYHKTTDYVGEFVYQGDSLLFVNHEEGRILVTPTPSTTTLLSNWDCTTTAGYLVYGTATISNTTLNGQSYLQVVSNVAASNQGFNTPALSTPAGTGYRLQVSGYSQATGAKLTLSFDGGTTVTLGPSLPIGTEGIATWDFIVPNGKTTTMIGVRWQSSQLNEALLVNSVNLYQFNATAEYQYHLKDHLGNVRMTFTTTPGTDTKKATYEDVNAASDQSAFLRYTNARRVVSYLFDHTNGSSPTTFIGDAERLSGAPNETYGLARSISVMPGDVINAEVYGKYVDSNPSNRTAALNTLISQVTAGTAGVVIDGSGYTNSTSSFPFAGVLSTSGSTGGPKAYLNWLVFDRNFVFLNGGYKRMSSTPVETGNDVAHELMTSGNINITQQGYVYIYLSNEETSPVEVYFDDFKVTQTKSAVVQMDDYYPFGLTFNSLSRDNSLINNFKYNGKELQNDLSLDWYDYGARMYMPEIGRWGVIDNLAGWYNSCSPYHYAGNNPVRYFEVDGNWFSGETDEVQKVKDEANSKINAANKSIGAKTAELINAVVSGNFKSASTLAKDITGLAAQRDGFENTVSEIDHLSASSQEYHVSIVSGHAGLTSWNSETNAVDLDINGETSLIAHELKHAYQFDSGTMSLGAGPGGTGRGFLLNDLHDEVEGYQRQALFNPTLLPTPLGKGINEHNIKLIQDDGEYRYAKLPGIQQNLPTYQDKGIQDATYQAISNHLNHAFRSGNKTYHPLK